MFGYISYRWTLPGNHKFVVIVFVLFRLLNYQYLIVFFCDWLYLVFICIKSNHFFLLFVIFVIQLFLMISSAQIGHNFHVVQQETRLATSSIKVSLVLWFWCWQHLEILGVIDSFAPPQIYEYFMKNDICSLIFPKFDISWWGLMAPLGGLVMVKRGRRGTLFFVNIFST